MGQWRYLPDVPPDTLEVYQTCDGWHADRHGLYRTGWMEKDFLSTSGTRDFTEVKNLPVASLNPNANIVGIVHTQLSPAVTGAAYVYNGSTWNDRTGGTNAHTGQQEAIAQLGNVTVVGTPANGCFSRDATTTNNFAAVASSPNCDILICNALNILIALGGGSTGSDAWATSDIASTSFVAGGSSVAASGNLRQTPGKITAGIPFGNDVIAWKNRGVYRGRYLSVGDVIWEWTLIPGGEMLGAWGPGCVVQANGIVYFLGDQGFWSFDGSNFRPCDEGIRRTLLFAMSDTNSQHTYTKLTFDSSTNLVGVWNRKGYTNGSQRASGINVLFTFNVNSGQWGYQSKFGNGFGDYGAICDGVEYTYSTFSAVTWPTPVTTFAVMDVSDDKIYTISAAFDPAVIDGNGYIPKLATGKIGDRQRVTAVTKVIPRWTTSDGVGSDLSTATLKKIVPYTADSIMETMTQGSDVTLTTDRYWADYRKTAWWHKFEQQINCEAVIDGFEIEQPKVGKK